MISPTYEPPLAFSQQNTSASLAFDFSSILRRRWSLLLAGTLAGIAIAALYAFTAQVSYESTVQILVIQKDAKLATQTANAQLGLQSSIGEELLATHMQIIASPRIVEEALDTHSLLDLESLRGQLEDRGENQSLENAAVGYILENLHVKRGGDGRAKDAQVLQVTFRHVSDIDCSKILTAIVESYQRFLSETVQGSGSEAADLIANASSVLEKKVADLDKSYRDFLEQAPMVWREGTTLNPHEVRLVELQTELSRVQVRRTEVSSRLALVEATLAAPPDEDGDDQGSKLQYLSMVDNADIDRLSLLFQVEKGDPISESFQANQPVRAETASAEFDRLLVLKLEAEKLALEFGPNHPKFVETQRQIRQMEDFLSKRSLAPAEDRDAGVNPIRLAKAYSLLLQHDLTDLNRREQDLMKLAEQEQADAKRLVRFELEQSSRHRALDRAHALYDTVIERLGEINLLKDYGGFHTEVISPVEIGEQAWPKISLVLALGGVFGICLGTGLATWAELSDPSFRNPDDIRQELKLPILTHVPFFPTAKLGLASSGHKIIDSRLAALHRPESREAEAFRGLRTVIYSRSRSVDRPIVQVASPNHKEGTTTLVANLAVSISQTNKKVLLIDAEMRRPQLHELFSVEGETGLSALLMGEQRIEDAIRGSGLPNLSILPCGRVPANPSELITLPTFGQLLNVVRDEYDFVLIDGPPIIPVSDALTIAAHVDFVLLNLSLTKLCRFSARSSLERLSANDGAEVLGVVVNSASRRGRGYKSNRFEQGMQHGFAGSSARNRVVETSPRNGEYHTIGH